MLQTPNPPNLLVYQAFRETFAATSSVVRISSLEGGIVEQCELHVTTTPQSTSLKREFGTLIFRIVGTTTRRPIDRNGNGVVGGVNTFPAPVHVVLFLAPQTVAMLSQRASTGGLTMLLPRW